MPRSAGARPSGRQAPSRRVPWVLALGWWVRDYASAVAGQLTSWGHRHRPELWEDEQDDRVIVLLLPGVYERWSFLLPLARALRSHGFAVRFAPELGWNTREILPTAREVARGSLASLPPNRAVVLLGHSKGGLIGRTLLDAPWSPLLLHPEVQLLTVSTPFRGSRYASLFWNRPLRALRPQDRFFGELLQREPATNLQVTSLVPRFDPHVPPSDPLPGSTVLSMRTPGHFWSVRSRAGIAEILRTLNALVQAAPGASGH